MDERTHALRRIAQNLAAWQTMIETDKLEPTEQVCGFCGTPLDPCGKLDANGLPHCDCEGAELARAYRRIAELEEALAILRNGNARLSLWRADAELLLMQGDRIVQDDGKRIAELEADRARFLRERNGWVEHATKLADRALRLESRIAELVAACEAALPWIASQIEYPGDPCEKIANEMRAVIAKTREVVKGNG